MQRPFSNPWLSLPTRDPETGDVNAVIETPKGSSCKVKLSEKTGVFELSHVLPAGSVFPFDFGFVPGTRAEDGDPLDVLVLLEGTTCTGCRVPCRLVGVLEAVQRGPSGRRERNDRLVAVATQSRLFRVVESIDDLPGEFLDDIEAFFLRDHEARGKAFRFLKRRGPHVAERLLRQAEQGGRAESA